MTDFDYVLSELQEIQSELESFPPAQAFGGLHALTERLEGIEARVGEIEERFVNLGTLIAILPE